MNTRVTRRTIVAAMGAGGGAESLLATVGCGAPGGEPARSNTATLAGRLSFMHYRKADEQPTIQEMVDMFTARRAGLTVEVVAQPDDFDQKLQILFAAGTAPDVYL